MQNENRLVLGTAQLGMPYGIANTTGQPDLSTAKAIVQEACKYGIREFDSAQAYGKSEEILGQCLSELGINHEVMVISKLNPDLDHLDRDKLSISLNQSLARLHVPKLAGLMLHREGPLNLWRKGLEEILLGFVDDGKIDRIGVSVYSPKKALQALQIHGIEMVQLPTNILDRRFVDAGVFDLARKKGKQLYIRSVFLQGLLLMESHGLPIKMQFARPVLEKLQSVGQAFNLTPLEMALGYVKAEFPEAKIIFGVETIKQLKNDLRCWNSTIPKKFINHVRREFGIIDEIILNPVLWPR